MPKKRFLGSAIGEHAAEASSSVTMTLRTLPSRMSRAASATLEWLAAVIGSVVMTARTVPRLTPFFGSGTSSSLAGLRLQAPKSTVGLARVEDARGGRPRHQIGWRVPSGSLSAASQPEEGE